MKKKIIIIAVVLVICIVLCLVFLRLNKPKKIERPNYDYIASIYHSEMMGMDAGTEYIYYIYKSDKKDNEYFYVKVASKITIAGAGEVKNVSSRKILNKEDLFKIEDDIKKDKEKNAKSNVTYSYGNSSESEKLESISDLANKLFK